MKKLEKKTFMSWDNYGERAVALCDASGYFHEAINCMRDGDMGEKKDGVYDRIWYSDYIENGEHDNLRPATKREVDLYLSRCDIEWPKEYCEKVVLVTFGYDRSEVYVRGTVPFWKKWLLKKIL